MMTTAAVRELISALTASPTQLVVEGGCVARERNTVAWQVMGAAACLAVLVARAAGLVGGNAYFRGSGLVVLFAFTLTIQVLGYITYIFAAAAVVHALIRTTRTAVTYRRVLTVVSYSTLPLLVGWVVRAVVAWTTTPAGLVTVRGFRPFVERIWEALAFNVDLSVLWFGPPGIEAGALGAVSVFWVWHGLLLWRALRRSFNCSRLLAAVAFTLLLAAVVATGLLAQVVGHHWADVVQWSDPT